MCCGSPAVAKLMEVQVSLPSTGVLQPCNGITGQCYSYWKFDSGVLTDREEVDKETRKDEKEFQERCHYH